jgi:pyridinium-3,5-biscarboxylic acid mononucleotide sulfurtransferase
MDSECRAKLDKLKKILLETGGCVVAYSGGCDSSLLATVAREVLGDRSLTVIATSSTYPKREYEQAVALVEEKKIPYLVIHSEELDIPGFRENPPDRCYHCKKELFTKIKQVAREHGLSQVVDGSNADDVTDYRPGLRALAELGILSPLRMAGLTKAEIRTISREVYHLPTAGKPAMACLSSRFPYGSAITPEKLKQIEAIENFLADRGFSGGRARHHDRILRLELLPDQMKRLLESPLREECVKFIKDQGFKYVTLDLEGYRTGSLNEVLEEISSHGK